MCESFWFGYQLGTKWLEVGIAVNMKLTVVFLDKSSLDCTLVEEPSLKRLSTCGQISNRGTIMYKPCGNSCLMIKTCFDKLQDPSLESSDRISKVLRSV